MSARATYTYRATMPWLTLFLLLKLASTSLAAWSWWWVLLPQVPVLVKVLRLIQAAGYLR